ncbi:MAG: type IX secretion system membrane protein PorP/SprF, partial [Crocinitomicaceae bacterium]
MRHLFHILSLSFCLSLNAQDISFSDQKLAAPYFNPALLGNTYGLEISHLYRNQFPAETVGYQTHFFQTNYGFEKHKMWIGLTACIDNFKTYMSNQNFALTFSKFSEINTNISLRFGAKVGWTTGWTNLTYGNLTDPRRGFLYDESNSTRIPFQDGDQGFEAAAGISSNIYRFTIGYAARHLQQPILDYTTEKNRRILLNHSIILGYDFDIATKNQVLHIQPFFIEQIQKNSDSFQAGIALSWNGITLQGSINESYFSIGGGYSFKDKYVLRY